MEMRSIVTDLRKRSTKQGQASVARELGVSRSYLSHILAGRRQPGPKLLRAMGFKVTYQPTNGS